MELFVNVTSSRVQSGRLFSPELALDLYAGAWAMGGSHTDWAFDEQTAASGIDTLWTTLYTCYIGGLYEDSSFDDTFDTGLVDRVTIKFEAKVNNTNDVARLRITVDGSSSSDQVVSNTTYALKTFTLDLGDPITHGVNSFTIDRKFDTTNGGTTISAQRQISTWGLDSGVQARNP